MKRWEMVLCDVGLVGSITVLVIMFAWGVPA